MADDDEEDQTLIAAPMPAGLHYGGDPDALPDEDRTLIAMPRGAFLRAPTPPPRPAAGLPPATPPPPRPAAGYAPPRPAAGLPPAAHPPMRQAQASAQAQPQQTDFVPVTHTLEMPRVTPPPYVPRPLPAPPPPFAVAAAVSAAAVSPPPALAPSSEVVLAAPEGLPAVVVRFVLVCGLVTVLGLLALIYLQI